MDTGHAFLTVKEVASKLRIGASEVYELIAAGEIVCHRFGRRRGRIAVSEADLDCYIASCRGVEQVLAITRPQSRHQLRHLKL